jgi:hypothetical protein
MLSRLPPPPYVPPAPALAPAAPRPPARQAGQPPAPGQPRPGPFLGKPVSPLIVGTDIGLAIQPSAAAVCAPSALPFPAAHTAPSSAPLSTTLPSALAPAGHRPALGFPPAGTAMSSLTPAGRNGGCSSESCPLPTWRRGWTWLSDSRPRRHPRPVETRSGRDRRGPAQPPNPTSPPLLCSPRGCRRRRLIK